MKHYTTQLFEMMQQHHCATLPTLLRYLPRKEMSEQCQMELEFLSEFSRGNMVVSQDEDGEIYIDSVFGDKNYHGHTTDECSTYSIHFGNEKSEPVCYLCYMEKHGKFTALVYGGESLAIWPNEYLRKREDLNEVC